ncbi:hypothetical protein JNEOFJEA_00107 [Aeromonas phage UP87]|nr:hypothetical protein JNEOFJEA_00107 [Aeromonas phage UP87]
MLEIERKWIVPVFPFQPTATFRKQHIAQFYHEGARYRSVMEEGLPEVFVKTMKTGQGLVREEIETDISREEINKIHAAAGFPNCVVKTRWFVATGYSYHVAELDVLSNGDMYVEIEFKTPYEAINFTELPVWFGEEVTDDIYHTNYEIFKRINGVK